MLVYIALLAYKVILLEFSTNFCIQICIEEFQYWYRYDTDQIYSDLLRIVHNNYDVSPLLLSPVITLSICERLALECNETLGEDRIELNSILASTIVDPCCIVQSDFFQI